MQSRSARKVMLWWRYEIMILQKQTGKNSPKQIHWKKAFQMPSMQATQFSHKTTTPQSTLDENSIKLTHKDREKMASELTGMGCWGVWSSEAKRRFGLSEEERRRGARSGRTHGAEPVSSPLHTKRRKRESLSNHRQCRNWEDWDVVTCTILTAPSTSFII